jgi:excisionase family DNA binding protein
MKPTRPDVLRVSEVASRLQVSERTIWRLIATGELPAFHVERQVRIRRDWYVAFTDRAHGRPQGPFEVGL